MYTFHSPPPRALFVTANLVDPSEFWAAVFCCGDEGELEARSNNS
jgi:hypothetical protein